MHFIRDRIKFHHFHFCFLRVLLLVNFLENVGYYDVLFCRFQESALSHTLKGNESDELQELQF